VALREVDRMVEARACTYAHRLSVVDLGTGSGAIALSVASERPLTDVWATDVSDAALAVARANLAGLGRAGARVRLGQGSWFEALPGELAGTVGVIVSNPPYVADDDALPPEVADWEPVGALRAGEHGLRDLQAIVAGAPGWLAPGGALIVELDPRQVEPVQGAARDAGFAETAVHRDLAGRERMVVARLAASSTGRPVAPAGP
jgi:release factor glutamine methyltransferase